MSSQIMDGGLEASLLRKFFRMRAGKKRHIYESDVPKGFPPHSRKDIMKAAKNLYKKGLLRKFPHGSEHVWQLNLDRIEEVKGIIRKHFLE